MEDILILDNREFLIIKEVSYNDANYIYVVATDGTNDIAFLKESIEDGIKYVTSITDKEELKIVTNLFK